MFPYVEMAPSSNFNTLWNIVFPNKKALFTHTLVLLKFSTPVIQSDVFPVPVSTDEEETHETC